MLGAGVEPRFLSRYLIYKVHTAFVCGGKVSPNRVVLDKPRRRAGRGMAGVGSGVILRSSPPLWYIVPGAARQVLYF